VLENYPFLTTAEETKKSTLSRGFHVSDFEEDF
jgi:hypothetical protein